MFETPQGDELTTGGLGIDMLGMGWGLWCGQGGIVWCGHYSLDILLL